MFPGFVRFDVQLCPEEAAVFRRALAVATSRAWTAEDVPAVGSPAVGQRRVDALVAVAEAYLDGSRSAGPPVEVVVHVEAGGDGGGTLDDGTALSPATAERLTCDAAVVEVVEDSLRKRSDPAAAERRAAARLHGGTPPTNCAS